MTVEEARNLALKVLDLAIYEGQLRAVVGHATYDRLIDHAKSLLTESPLKPLPDWRTAPQGQAIEHDRSVDAALAAEPNINPGAI